MNLRYLIAAVLICTAGLARADSWAVTGVASNDVLNIRYGPGTGFGIADQLGPNEGGLRKQVCVLLKPTPQAPASLDLPEWCAISRDGTTLGWVNARFLARQDSAEDVPVIGAAPGYNGCWYLGETEETNTYLDDSNRLVGCFPNSEGALKAGGQPLGNIAGLDLYTIPG